MDPCGYRHLIPAIAAQSPTTPSAKRLAQNPLTFAVTPPPARSKTPTTNRSFSPSFPTESSPKTLSPVVEKQITSDTGAPVMLKTTSPSGDTVKVLSNVERPLDHSLRPADESVSKTDYEDKQLIPAESISHSKNFDDANTETLHSASLDNDHHANESETLQSHSPVNLVSGDEEQLSEATQESFDTSHPVEAIDIPMDHKSNDNEAASGEMVEPSSPMNKAEGRNSLLPSPVAPTLTTSPNFESTGETEHVHHDSNVPIEALETTQQNRQPSVDVHEPDFPPQSTSSAVQDAAKTVEQHAPLVPDSDEVHSDTHDQAVTHIPVGEHPDALSDVPLHSTGEENVPLPSVEQHRRNSTTRSEGHPSPSSDTAKQLSASSPMTEHFSSVPSDDRRRGSLSQEHNTHEPSSNESTVLSTSTPEHHEPAEMNDSTIGDSSNANANAAVQPSHLSNTSPRTSRSPSPIMNQKKDRSRSPSPILEDNQRKSRSPSPSHHVELAENSSQSPIVDRSEQGSRSTSPSDKQRQSSRSPSPSIEQKPEQRSMEAPSADKPRGHSPSRSPTVEHKSDDHRPPSPASKEKQSRSRSPSITNQDGSPLTDSAVFSTQGTALRSRSPSPSIDQTPATSLVEPVNVEQSIEDISAAMMDGPNPQRSRSPSPVAEGKRERSRSPSIVDSGKQQRSRSPSPSTEKIPSTSPVESVAAEQSLEEISAPVMDDRNPQRSRSASLISANDEQRASAPGLSSTQQASGRSRSPSPIIEEKRERSRSPSIVDDGKQQRSRSPSPSTEKKPTERLVESINTEQSLEDISTHSPVTEHERKGSSSSPVMDAQNRQRSRSPSVVDDNKQQRSRSPSPSIQQNLGRSTVESVNAEQALEDIPSHPSVTKQERKGSSSSAVADGQSQQRSRSASLTGPEDKQITVPALSGTQQMTERSRSPSPVAGGNPSIADNGKQQRSRSPSPSIKEKPEQPLIESMTAQESLPAGASPRAAVQGQRSPSPTIEQKSDASLVNLNGVDSHHDQPTKFSPAVSPMNETKERRSGSGSSETTNKNQSEGSAPADKLQDTFSTSEMSVSSLKNDRSSRSPSMASPVREHAQLIANANNELLNEFSSSKHEEKTPHSNDHDKPHVSPLISPVHTTSSPMTDNSSTQDVIKSALIDSTPSNPTHSTERRLSTQRSSFDQHHPNSASIPIPSTDRHPSIPRSLSQTSLARPTTLRFSPNDHDLDGLYMPDQYNDEDLLVDAHEHHRSSAPSTTSFEYRRPSLAQDYVGEQQTSSINPIEISKRLSIVEKSRMQGIAAAFASGDAFIGWVISWCPPPLLPVSLVLFRESRCLSSLLGEARHLSIRSLFALQILIKTLAIQSMTRTIELDANHFQDDALRYSDASKLCFVVNHCFSYAHRFFSLDTS